MSDVVLGLSHIFGGTADLEAASDFWRVHSFQEIFRYHHHKPDFEKTIKSEWLMPFQMAYLEMNYLESKIGIEFLRFQPEELTEQFADESDRISGARLLIALKGEISSLVIHRDQEGNTLALDPSTDAVGIYWRTPDRERAIEELARMGFTDCQRLAGTAIKALLPFESGSTSVKVMSLGFETRLFPSSRINVFISQDANLDCEVRRAERNFNGLSFFVHDLDEVPFPFVYKGRHTGLNKNSWDVGIYQASGIFFEFMQMVG